MIWKSVWSFCSNIQRTILYRYIYSVTSVGEYFVRYGTTNKIPKCLMCNSGVFPEKHIFQNCPFFRDQRQKLYSDIQQHSVMILSFRTDRSEQTVQTQIRLLLEEQSDQGLHCLQFPLHRLDSLLYV